MRNLRFLKSQRGQRLLGASHHSMVALDSQRVTGTAFVWLKMGKMVEGNVEVGTKRTTFGLAI